MGSLTFQQGTNKVIAPRPKVVKNAFDILTTKPPIQPPNGIKEDIHVFQKQTFCE